MKHKVRDDIVFLNVLYGVFFTIEDRLSRTPGVASIYEHANVPPYMYRLKYEKKGSI